MTIRMQAPVDRGAQLIRRALSWGVRMSGCQVKTIVKLFRQNNNRLCPIVYIIRNTNHAKLT